MSVMSVPSLGAHGEAASRPGRRVPLQVTLETTSRLVYPGDATYDAGCDGSPMAEVMGVGASTEFGVLKTRQALCLGGTDYSGDLATIPVQGAFKLTDARGRTIIGQLRGRFQQTFSGGMGEVTPWGLWILEGDACVSGGTRFDGIADDCAAGRSAPFRGFENFNVPQATLFFDQTLGVTREGR